MRTRRVDLETQILREARAFRDSCDDGLGLAANTGAYQAWLALSRSLDEYDGLVPDDIRTRAHVANADSQTTAHLAAELIVPDQESIRYDLLMQYRVRVVAFGQNDDLASGLTDSEMEFVLRKPHETVSSARNWLMHAGFIHDSGVKRRNPSKRPAIVWTLTPAGLRALDVAAAA